MIYFNKDKKKKKKGARLKVETFPAKGLSVLVHVCGRGFESHI